MQIDYFRSYFTEIITWYMYTFYKYMYVYILYFEF